jgi:hypothetical protein
LVLPAGDCETWVTDWSRVTDTGQPVPMGNYTLRARMYLAEGTVSAEIQITVAG